MAIAVLCSGCKARFTVSDQYAGQTGPCPKCKKPITIPAVTAQAVVIHEPEPAASSAAGGRPPLAPIRRSDAPVSATRIVAMAAAAGAVAMAAWATGRVVGPAGLPPAVLLAAAFAIAVPCVRLGYAAVRNRELEPFSGRPLLVRSTACAAVYAGLWAVKGLLPEDATKEMWQWLYLGPMFVVPGALAALACLELEWGAAVAHFSLYAIVTALLRWLVGLPPL